MPAANASTVANGPFCSCRPASARARSTETVSAEKAGWIEAAEKQIGVGDGGQGATAETDGAGIGASGFGTDAQHAAAVEAGKGTAAGARGVNLQHRHADGNAGDHRFAGAADTALGRIGEENIGRGAAHVEADDAVEARGLRDAQAPITPPAGPESTVRTGSCAASRAETIPPEDCMTATLPS